MATLRLSDPAVAREAWRSRWWWLLLGATVLLLAVTFRPVIEGDGVGYYSYLHAAFVSHAFSFESEYSAAIAAQVDVYHPSVTDRSASGSLTDYFPVGAAVLSAPFYLVALAFRASGEPQYGTPFIEAFVVASLLFGMIGLALSYRFATQVVRSRQAGLAGAAGAFLATPFFYYGLSEPSYAHTFSVFCASAFLYLWWAGPPRRRWTWFGLGVLGGVMAMTRFQDGLLVAVLLIDIKRLRWSSLALLPGLILGFAPQLAIDQIQFGGLLPMRPPGQELTPLHGHYLQPLFSSADGLFVWTPAAAAAVLGIVRLRDRRLQAGAALALALEVLVLAWTPDSPGASFGNRRLLEMTPLIAVGLASVVTWIGQRKGWVLVGVLTAWNLLSLANFEYLLTPGADPGYARLAVGQLAGLPYLPRLFAKGAVLRDLVLAQAANHVLDPVRGLAMLMVEASCAAVALFLATHPVGGSLAQRDARPDCSDEAILQS